MNETNTPQAETADGWEWAFVEIFGHRSHAGRTREVEKFGAKMLRIDVPIFGGTPEQFETHFYTGGAIFSFRLSTEAAVREANRPHWPPSRITYEPPTATTYNDHDHTQPGPDCFDDDEDDARDDDTPTEWTP